MRHVLSLPLILALGALVGCTQERITGGPRSIDIQHPLADVAVVPNPTVVGPIAATALPGDPLHAYPFFSTAVDLAVRGYVEAEFYIEGTANRYTLPDRATASVIDGGHAYRTRIVVRRPAAAAAFNGTVIMEWQNVTVGFDFDGLWLASHDHLMRRGYAWIGVSNQANAVQVSTSSLRAWSPSRYGSLDVTEGGAFTHDELSYDIFSQAAQAVRTPLGVDPMGGLRVQRVVAAGISQAADYLGVYHNSIQPLIAAFDGFLLIGGGAILRTDLTVPVFKLLSETDLVGTTTVQAPLRQPQSDHFRRWEVAGASHVPYQVMHELLLVRVRDLGAWSPPTCIQPSLSRIPYHYVLNAAVDLMVDWVKRGIVPSLAPDIQVDLGTMSVVRDADGNAFGGIQLPQQAVPTATNSGVNGPVTKVWCALMGAYVPFTTERLAELYPSHEFYVSEVIEATRAARTAGYIVGHDAAETISAAAQSDIGRRGHP